MAIPLNNHSSSKNFTEQAMSDGIMGSRVFLPRKGHNESIGLPLVFFLIGYVCGGKHCVITLQIRHHPIPKSLP